MAVQFDSEHTRSSLYHFYPEQLTIVPALNGRHDLPDISALVQDILARGQIVPVTIRRDGGQAVLVAGFSRWRAVSEINTKGLAPVKLQLKCAYTQCTEAEAFLANIAENRTRTDTTPLDDALNLHRLVSKYAMTEEQAALVYFPGAKDERLKEAVKWVKHRMELYDLAPEAADAFLHGRLKESAARAIAKLSQAQQKERIAAAGDSGKITAKDAKPSTATKLPASASAPVKARARVDMSELAGLIGSVRNTLDEDDLAGDGEYITVGLPQIKALLEYLENEHGRGKGKSVGR